MQDVLKRFYDYIVSVERYSDNTKQSYQNDLDGFASFLCITYQLPSFHEITHFHIRSWIVSLMDSGHSVRTIHRKISSLSTFFKYLRRFEGLATDPLKKIVRPKSMKRLPISIPSDDLITISSLELTETDDYQANLEEMVVLMLYSAGLRRSELIQLREEDIDRQRLMLKIVGKGKKERFVPIKRELLTKIDEFIGLKNKTINVVEKGPIFLTRTGKPMYPKMVYNIVSRFLNNIPNLERRSPHILRHSFATHLSDAGADINAIKMLLGHSSLAATEVYMHNAPQRLRSVYLKAHPRSEE